MVDRHFASGGIHPCDDGEWVSYDDYAALEARVAELEKDAARYRWLCDGRLYPCKYQADGFIDSQMTDEA